MLLHRHIREADVKNPFIDHSWSKIVERDAVAKVVIDAKIKQLDAVAEAIRKNSGSDAVENVLSYKLVKRALEQCLTHLSGATSTVTADDYYIYTDYAEYRIIEAQRIIDSELGHLGL